ncbi:hypothetical protein E2C01_029265 [Portunus trituberculatus]|uniref:Uncharacterized protein n=1 Tax=Portunus trituberculatus TaxID=210409 RepID=A0A5B7ERE9_PORTR|nr:hypothetical protein [Portunus trituberculatus]
MYNHRHPSHIYTLVGVRSELEECRGPVMLPFVTDFLRDTVLNVLWSPRGVVCGGSLPQLFWPFLSHSVQHL